MRMIKSLLFVVTFAFTLNAADDSALNTMILKKVYENVVLNDSKQAITDIKNLANAIEEKDAKKAKNEFANFVESWKKVEAFYILGDINEDYIDTPRYIDIYHNGNEDITKQLDRALKSGDEPKVALFKNSLKSINALEYILFTKDIKNKTVSNYTLKMTSTIQNHLQEIYSLYVKNEETFLEDLKKANAIVINTLIQNSYKLKEWRIGDVAGLSKKYKGKADKRRGEYFLSKNSANAIKAILDTYKAVLNHPDYEDFGDYLLTITSGDNLSDLRKALDESLVLVSQIQNDDLSNAKELFKKANKAHVILFVDMIEDLSINAKILDADGD